MQGRLMTVLLLSTLFLPKNGSPADTAQVQVVESSDVDSKEATGTDAVPSIELLEFLGAWDVDEEGFIDPMEVDALFGASDTNDKEAAQ